MRRILAIIVLAAILVLAISVPALAKPSDPPNAFGEYQAWWAQRSIQVYGLPMGQTSMAPVMWFIQAGWLPYDNGGQYIASLKEDASY